MTVINRINFRRLAELAEKSIGYTVTTEWGTLSDIRFDRSASGRRNRAYVRATYTNSAGDSAEGMWPSDVCPPILD